MILKITFVSLPTSYEDIRFYYTSSEFNFTIYSYFINERIGTASVSIGTDLNDQAAIYQAALLLDYSAHLTATRIDNAVYIEMLNGSDIFDVIIRYHPFATFQYIEGSGLPILVLKAPEENRVLLDCNNSVISIQSQMGAGYYFRAKIFIDNELFDTQSWSREDAFTANKDLKKLFYAYFNPTFTEAISNSIDDESARIKKVSIEISEYRLINDGLKTTVTLPDFYIIFGQTPEYFSDALKVQFLDLKPDVVQIPFDAKLSIPFFVNAQDEDITCKVVSNNMVLYEETIIGVVGKKAFKFNVNLSHLVVPMTSEVIELIITCGAVTITKTLKLFLLPPFPIKSLAFRNNFGYYIRAYFDGDLEVTNGYKQESYTQFDGTEKLFEVSKEATYTINTGTLLVNEKSIIDQICSSIDVRILYGQVWLPILTKTKKYTEFKDNVHGYSEDLVFTFFDNADIPNEGFVPYTPVE